MICYKNSFFLFLFETFVCSGGIKRDWVGVPRKLFEPGAKQARCACISSDHLLQGNLDEYENCPSDSISCYVKTN